MAAPKKTSRRGGGGGSRRRGAAGSAKRERKQSAAGQAAEHNAGERNKIIRECMKIMERVDEERKSLGEDASGVRQRLRDANIDVPSFFAAYAIAKKEKAARETYLDGLRESLNAMRASAQGDLFPEETERRVKEEEERLARDEAEKAETGIERPRHLETAEAAGQA